MKFQDFIEYKFPMLKGRDYTEIKWSVQQVILLVEEWEALNRQGHKNPNP